MRLEELPGDFADRLVRDCPDAIIYADAQGRIRFWNDAATRPAGLTKLTPMRTAHAPTVRATNSGRRGSHSNASACSRA